MSGYIGNILVPQATQTRDSFIATAGQTSFPTSGYTPNFLDVYLNGIKLHSSDFTATNGSDVVLTTGAAVNDVIEVVAFNAFDIASGTFDDLTVNNNIVVSGTVDGRDIAADGTKLDGIESGATGDQTNAEIRAAVEAATDSNVFTDADHTKLNAIEAGATADQTKADIDALNINADTLDGQHGSYYTGYADTAVANIVDSAPGTLDTLNELAAALGDDPNFATTVTNSIATKLPLAGGTLTGDLILSEGSPTITLTDTDGNTSSHIKTVGSNMELHAQDGNMRFRVGSSGLEHMRIAPGGDISFYEDTGTTAKFFWDSSAESLGIGTSSPSSLLQLSGSPVATSGALATFRNSDATASNTSFGGVLFNSSPGTDYSIGKSNVNDVTTLSFRNGNTGVSYMDIDSSGNVGIGDSSPDSISSSVSTLSLGGINAGVSGGLAYKVNGSGKAYHYINSGYLLHQALAGTGQRFLTNNTEAMRIDTSGNLLVGKTSADTYNNTNGIELQASGLLTATRTGIAQILNREDSDGDIAVFRKDGSTVGSIGAKLGGLYIADTGIGLRFDSGGTDDILPSNNTGDAVDASTNLGSSGARFKDFYLSGNAYASTYRHDGDSDTYLNFPAANQLSLVGGGATIVKAYQIAGSYGVLEMHGSGSATYPNFTFNGDSNTGMYRATTDTLAFTTAGAERMRIDSSGNVLVGKTSASIGTVGCELRNDGYILGVNDGDAPLFLNRKSSDGDIAKFYKDGVTVGSIGAYSGDLWIGQGNTGLLFNDGGDVIRSANASGGNRDGVCDLGASNSRFKDAHFSGTVSATSFTGSGANLTGIEGVPQGVIVMWSGQTTAIPTGWALCDGTNGTPNLIDKFIMGASASNETTTGGANSRTLSTANIPNHTHSFSGTTNTTGAHTHDVYIRRDQYLTGDGITGNDTNGTDEGIYLPKISGVTSSNGDHSHTISGTTGSTGSGSSFDNRPAYMALAYIMKT